MNRWFLFDDEPFPGNENMARDEFLLERAECGGTEPVLRLYTFRPPAVTVGYHQNPNRILDIGSLRSDGIDVVRRITGGRALLHDGELTYCVAASLDSKIFGSGLHETFLKISGAIAMALRFLGVDACISDGRYHSGDGGLISPCLVSVSRYEVTAGGRKIVASAQRRTKSAFLQHGSILLTPASGGIAGYLNDGWDYLGDRITSVSEETGCGVDERNVRSALIAAFAELFSVGWEPFELSWENLEDIGRRRSEKRAEFCENPGNCMKGNGGGVLV